MLPYRHQHQLDRTKLLLVCGRRELQWNIEDNGTAKWGGGGDAKLIIVERLFILTILFYFPHRCPLDTDEASAVLGLFSLVCGGT